MTEYVPSDDDVSFWLLVGPTVDAGMDGLVEEPTTASNPLFDLKKVVLSSHNAAASSRVVKRHLNELPMAVRVPEIATVKELRGLVGGATGTVSVRVIALRNSE